MTGLSQKTSLVECGVATRPLDGQTVSGDLHLIQPFDQCVLLAVVDGIGHGKEATVAAQKAVVVLEKCAREPLVSVVRRCHQALNTTRGVVMTLAAINGHENTLAWLGIGNVEGRLIRATGRHLNESVLLRGGVVGYQLPPLQVSLLPVAPGDLLIFATDGVDAAFDGHVDVSESPARMSERILNEYFKGSDDALVLVARYLGPLA
jgi:serine phosphatase RsbU (regulator of sigma subunit)